MSGVIIAIDPGAHGAIAWMDASGRRHVVNMPDTPRDILDQIRLCCQDGDVTDFYSSSSPVCYIENVANGIPGQSSSATAKFARHCGHLEGFLLAEDIRTVRIIPSKWEKTMGIGTSSGLTKSEWKNKLKAKAQELYPDKKVTLVNADALLILEYAIKNER